MDISPKEQKDGEEFARTFSNFVNDMRRGPKKVALEKMMREHRTLQQNMMRFFLMFVEMMAEQQMFDMRNEASVKLAKSILANVPEQDRQLPYV